MVHISQCTTAHEMWKSLKGVHDNKGYQALVVYLQNFYCLVAEEGDDIINHLNKIKEGHEHINMMGDPCFYILDIMFKILICQSLPSTWDNFTDAYIGSQTFNHEDPRRSINSQNFIGILKTEYNRRVGRKLESSQGNVTPQVNQTRAYKRPLLSRISQPPHANNNTSSPSAFCKLCRKPGHFTNDCTHFEKKCTNCNQFGHEETTCCFEKMNKKYKSRKSCRNNSD